MERSAPGIRHVDTPRPRALPGAPARATASLLPLLVALVACSPSPQATRPAPPSDPPAPTAVVVDVVEVLPGQVGGDLVSHGSLVARRVSPLGTEVGGRVAAVHVEVGDRVERGAPLFEIDPAPYALALAEAEAGLDLARAEAAQTASELRRTEELRARQVASQQETERLATSLRVARARERQAETRRDLAARDLAATGIRAPFAGSISERLVDEGTLVTPQTPVVVLQESAELEAHVSIPETYLGRVHAGDPAQLFVESLPDPIPAKVHAVSDAVDPETRTFLVRLAVPNPAYELKSGAFLRAAIRPSPRHATLVVPRSALRTDEGRAHVLVVREGRAERVDVQLGLPGEDSVEVERGLAPGDRVVVDAATNRVVPDQPVVVRASEVAAR